MVRLMAQYHDVWVVTRSEGQVFIDEELARRPIPRLHCIYYDLPQAARWWTKGEVGIRLHYYLWQLGIYRLVKKLHQDIGFHLVHHVTFVKYWNPSFLIRLPVPFLWGPVGGAETMPMTFLRGLGFKGQVFEILRTVARWIGEHDPFVGLAARKSHLGLATTEETAARLRKLGVKQVEILSECGLDKTDLTQLGSLPLPRQPGLHFISIGRLLHLKGFHLGLQAFSKAQLRDAQYWIVGEGPFRNRLEQLARELGIEDRVHFCGLLSRPETLKKLGSCHVLVHPSLHESGGWVCLEAMAAGRPVVCLDLGGPGMQVTSETGLKIPAHSPMQAVEDMAKAMKRLADDPGLRNRMGQAGRKRVNQQFAWASKGELFDQLYNRIVKGTQLQELPLQESKSHTSRMRCLSHDQ